MRRVSRVACQVRDLLGHRLQIVRLGGSLEPFVDLAAQRAALAGLVDVGIVAEEDWAMSDVPLAVRGAALDGHAAVVERRVLDRIAAAVKSLGEVDLRLLTSYVSVIVALVVEMAILCYHREKMLESLLAASRKRPRTSRRRTFRPAEVLDRSALHADPRAFLADAHARLAEAKADVAKARRRIAYLKTEREDPTKPPPYLAPSLVPFETPATLSLASAIRGAADDLLRPVTPVPLPDPAQRRR
jgi:hypothetical protein